MDGNIWSLALEAIDRNAGEAVTCIIRSIWLGTVGGVASGTLGAKALLWSNKSPEAAMKNCLRCLPIIFIWCSVSAFVLGTLALVLERAGYLACVCRFLDPIVKYEDIPSMALFGIFHAFGMYLAAYKEHKKASIAQKGGDPSDEQEDMAICTICLDPIHEATVLGCGHSFHTSCIKDCVFSDYSRGFMTPCPVCRVIPTKVADDDLEVMHEENDDSGESESTRDESENEQDENDIDLLMAAFVENNGRYGERYRALREEQRRRFVALQENTQARRSRLRQRLVRFV